MKFLLTMALMCGVAFAHAAEQTWAQLVAAAQREGRVAVLGPPDPEMRKRLPEIFKAKFGIDVDYIGGRTNEAAAKLRVERRSGIYTADVAFSGIQTMATIFHREKMLAPIKEQFIDPDVLDGRKWKRGKMWFVDPEEQYVLRLFNSVGAVFAINTSVVKPTDFRSVQDLLDPKWRGKIAFHDPSIPGTGSNEAARFYMQFGADFTRKLYVDQKPGISRDRRQLTDWTLRGTYPIVFGAEDDELEKMRKEGMPVMMVFGLPDMPGTLTAEGHVGMFSNAPHPNAAKLFINWIASKEGLEFYSRARGGAPTRNDIDARAYLPAEMIPTPGVNYFNSADWEFTVTTKEKIRNSMLDLMKGKPSQ